MNIYYKNSKKMAKNNGFLFQGNTKNSIPRSTFDFSKTNSDTMNFGEIKIGQWFETIAKDSIRGGVSESVIAAPLTAPANCRIKHINKSFYLPNTLLWKYWNEFCLQRPDGIFSSSQIANAVKEQNPWRVPSINLAGFIFPLIAFAKGMFLPKGSFYVPLDDNLEDKDYSFINPSGNTTNDGYAELMTNNFIEVENDYIEILPVNFIATDLSLVSDTSNTVNFNFSDGYRGLKMSSHLVFKNSVFQTPTTVDSHYFNSYYWENLPGYCPYVYNNVFESSEALDSINLSFDLEIPGQFVITTNSKGGRVGKYSPRFISSSGTVNLLSVKLPLPSLELSRQYGFTRLGMLYYCANSALRLLDSIGINYKMFLGCNFLDIINTEINALPLFCYQKIFFDHFSNKSVDFGMIDFSYANGPIFNHTIERGLQLSEILSNSGVDSKICELYSSPAASGSYGGSNLCWNLPLLNLPRNYNCVRDIYVRPSVSDCTDVFRLLLGFDIDKLVHFDLQDDSGRFNTLLPSFDLYHGLLHMQYSNFAPDYFTTAQYDPTQGNEQVSIPSTISQLREANALQEFFDANQWTRSIGEWLNSHFDSYSKYVGLTDAEFCGSSETNIVISEQLQTSETTENSALGERAGVGQGSGDSGLSSFTIGENGIFMCVHYIVMETSYIQGIQKKLFVKHSYLDYPFPELSNLSPESIDVRELCLSSPQPKPFVNYGNSEEIEPIAKFDSPELRLDHSNVRTKITVSDNDSQYVFGYTPRYSAYKFQFDEVKGEFVSSLDYWSDFRLFFSRPVLGHDFVSYELAYLYSNLNKIFAVYDDLINDHFYVNQLYNYEVTRSLPVTVKPKL